MKQFLKANAFAYYIDGGHIPITDSYNVKFTSTFADAKNPHWHQTAFQSSLTDVELDTLITALQNIRASKKPQLPKDSYEWLHKDEVKVLEITHKSGQSLVGYDRGLEMRNEFNLDVVDHSSFSVVIKIPNTYFTMTTSFFRGLFGPSVKHFGSAQKFMAKYKFEAPANWNEMLLMHAVNVARGTTGAD